MSTLGKHLPLAGIVVTTCVAAYLAARRDPTGPGTSRRALGALRPATGIAAMAAALRDRVS
ncbi:hypothetical protein AB0J90_35045 [Micromonospora sp. NPDC049523]|uniref:hypothetical protein n=1 Tax=Micromonospora sp. NPDC049523 TaxID=3155921 RepID=UPI003433C642